MSGLRRMGPIEALRAGGLGRRIPQLVGGLVLFGITMAMMIKATLGNSPWDVLHQGLARHLPMTIGQANIILSVIVLLAWIPMRQWPGLGTVLNSFVIGLVMDQAMPRLPVPTELGHQVVLLAAGIVLNGLATALYIGAQLGPGPRDGLMTGLNHLTGLSIRTVRTLIEIVVVAIGWLLGGVVGVGTVLFAVAIGPLVQAFLPWCIVRLDPPPPAVGVQTRSM